MITVITPTYNRAYMLDKCYQSLKNQTSKNYKWMVVDDGSVDDMEALVKDWQTEGAIEIQYIRKDNGGKASALNVAIDCLDTDYTVCLDSDDTFYESTIALAERQLMPITEDDCCGILALRNNPDGTAMGGREIPAEYRYVTAADIFMKLNLETEVICFYRTEILKRYRFPQFEEEKFVSPAWMQYEVTKDHRFQTSWDKINCANVNMSPTG